MSSETHGVFTECINTCTGINLNSGNFNKLFHLAPEQQSTRNLYDEFRKEADLIMEESGEDDIKAIICGGIELDKSNPESVKSFYLFNEIANILEKLGIEFNMLCGKKPGMPMENMYARGKHTKVWSDLFKNLFPTKDALQNPSRNDIIDALENSYTVTEFSDNIPIILE